MIRARLCKLVFRSGLLGCLLMSSLPGESGPSALEARSKRFYESYVSGNFRDAEPLVAPAHRDVFYQSQKDRIHSYRIARIKLADDCKSAEVTVIIRSTFPFAGRVVDTDMPILSRWTVIDGEWFWTPPEEGRSLIDMFGGTSKASLPVQAPAGLSDWKKAVGERQLTIALPLLNKPVLVTSAENQHQDSLSATNYTSAEMHFRIECRASRNFRLDPASGTIPSHGSVTITATFSGRATTGEQLVRQACGILTEPSGQVEFFVDAPQ